MKQYKILLLFFLIFVAKDSIAKCPQNPDVNNTESIIYITTSVTYGSGTPTISDQIIIASGGSLHITGVVSMSSSGRIQIQGNGSLIINGGTLQNAKIGIDSGGNLQMLNNGIINKAPGTELEVPQGANVYIITGTIN